MKRRTFLKFAASTFFAPAISWGQTPFGLGDPAMLKAPRLAISPRGLIHAAGRTSLSTNNGNLAGGTTASGRTFICVKLSERIRQSGIIKRVLANVNVVGPSNGWKFKVFRPNGSNFDFVGESELITPAGTGVQTFNLSSPIPCREGDVLGFWIIGHASSPARIVYATGSGTPTQRWVDGDQVTTSDFTANTVNNVSVNIQALVDEPSFAFGGDSIMAGHNVSATASLEWFTFAEATGPAGTVSASPPYQIAQLLRNQSLLYLNTAVGGYTWANVAATQLGLLTASNAAAWIIHCGINDVSTGRVWADSLADINTVKAGLPAGVKLFLTEILPWTSASGVQAAQIRDYNANYAAWCAANGAVLIPCHDTFGQLRVDTGFLDDLKSAYDKGDGTHLSQAGVNELARIIYQTLARWFLC